MKTKITIFVLFAVLLGCKKDNHITLTTDLTGCAVDKPCLYSYFDRADFNGRQPVSGNYRAFSYSSGNPNSCGPTASLYFKSALSNTEFVIDSNQIAAGQVVAYYFSCPCCEDIYLNLQKPIGGEIKGKRTDTTHWLINAKIVLGTSINMPLDTLVVNQYFTLAPLP